jgi:hypothetical protein
MVPTVISTEREALAVSVKATAPSNPPKGGTKGVPVRGGHSVEAGSVKPPENPAMVKTLPLDCERKGT